MAPLTRTASGLANLHLLHGVDYIVYTEGEPSIPAMLSSDVGFWRAIFEHYAPNSRFKVENRGSKTAITSIAETLESIDSHRIICAMDRDFSDLHNELLTQYYVIYTYGYSHENDLSYSGISADVISALFPNPMNIPDISHRVEVEWADLLSKLHWMCVADQILSFSFLSFFDRSGERFRAVFHPNGPPALPRANRPVALARLRHMKALRNQSRLVPPRFDGNTRRRLYGHLVGWLTLRISATIAARLGYTGRLDPNAFVAGLIGALRRSLASGSYTIDGYYRDAVSSVLHR